MYPSKFGLIIGFHGCDKHIRNAIVSGKIPLNSSTNDYDWLGSGMYFWENNQKRALDFATELKGKSIRNKELIKTPAVLGAIIDLGYCLDLLDAEFIELVKESYISFQETFKMLGAVLPENKPLKGLEDLLIRDLDCEVIENLHEKREINKLRTFDTVGAAFIEGEKLYPNAGFNAKNHIQICVRNPNCIKGFFIPREENTHFIVP